MNQTVTEKIISHHAGYPVGAGEIAIVSLDGAMATDATAPFAIRAFQEMGGTRLWNPEKVFLVIDHAAPAPNERISNLHQMMRAFAAEMGCKLYDVGTGICHQLMLENGHVQPGHIFLGADSHTPTYGAIGALGIGVGSTDLAGAWLTGQTWLKVPQTVKLVLDGHLRPGVSAKDVILFLVGQLGMAGATYQAVEFTGTAVAAFTLASRMTLANMVAEMGAKTAVVDMTGLHLAPDFEPIQADAEAQYHASHQFDLSNLRPQIAVPHSPDNISPIDAVTGQKINMAFIGSCTNSRLEDWHAAARILGGKQIAPNVRLLIAPASKTVFDAALSDGTVAALSAAGATFMTTGCGPCVGTHLGVPGNDEVVISTANRNFRGRMGNPNALVYLASPAVVAAAALAGEIIDPAEAV